MRLIGIARLGKDCEVRYTTEGTPVANFTAAFNYGQKDGQGKRPSTWVSFSLWGERAEKLSEYLTRGRELNIVAGDVHVETYEGSNGFGAKLVARVIELDFTNGTKDKAQQHGQAAAPGTAPRQPARTSAPKSGTGFDDMDNDIPFWSPGAAPA